MVKDRVGSILASLPMEVTHALILGGISSIDACAQDPAGTERVNVHAVMQLIDDLLAHNIVPIFASSDGVYDGTRGQWGEEYTTKPILTYGQQKLAIEQYLAAQSKPWIALRIAKVLDPELNTKGVLGPWIEELIAGTPIRCATDQRFNPVGIDDVINAILTLTNEKVGGLFNLGGRDAVSRLELLTMMKQALSLFFDLLPVIEQCSIKDFPFVEPRPIDTSMSTDKLRAAIQYDPEPLYAICVRAASHYATKNHGVIRQKFLQHQVVHQPPKTVTRSPARPCILLTGAGTILGHRLALMLADRGHHVKAIFRSNNARIESFHEQPNISPIKKNLSDPRSLNDLDAADCRAIIHLAAASPSPGIEVRDLVKDNILVTENLASYALRQPVRQFLFTSSMSVYGDVKDSVVSESTPIANPKPYGACKLVCEQMLADISDRIPAVALRIPALLGRGAHRHWLSTVLERAATGSEITIYNPSALHNNAVGVDSLAAFLESLLERDLTGFMALPLGAKDALTIEQVVRKFVDILGTSSKILVQNSSAPSFTIDFSLAQNRLGYSPPTMSNLIDSYARTYRIET